MYIVRGNNIFLRQAHFHPVHAAPQASTANAHNRCRIDLDGNRARNDGESLKTTSRFRVPGNIGNPMRVFLSEGPRIMRTGSTTWRDSTMTNFKLLGVGAILTAVIVTPAFAQQAVQEPGMQAFYQSLGVGSQSSAPTASAMASAPGGSYAVAPAKRISAKHRM
jgi:hypothetical protein